MGNLYGIWTDGMTDDEIKEQFRLAKEYRESGGRMTPTPEQLEALRAGIEKTIIEDGYSFDDCKFWNLPQDHELRSPWNYNEAKDNCSCVRDPAYWGPHDWHGKPGPICVAVCVTPGYIIDFYLTEDGLWWNGEPPPYHKRKGWVTG